MSQSMKKLLAGLFLLGFIGAAIAGQSAPDHLITGAPEYIVDGDTLDVDDTRIRLWGINTPERGQQGYEEAKEYLVKITANATLNCAAFYFDRYKRTVASCEIEGQDIGRMMVLSGMARDYTKYSKGFYANDELEAKQQKRGMWRN